MNNKYLKYKKKYFMLKGGILDIEELLDPELIDTDFDIIEDESIGLSKITLNIHQIAKHKNDFLWTKNIKKAHLKNIEPSQCNIKGNTEKYFTLWCRYYFTCYKLIYTEKLYEDIKSSNKIITPTYNDMCPYKYEFILKILGVTFNMYDSVYSRKIQRLIDDLVKQWVQNIYIKLRQREQNLNRLIISDHEETIYVRFERSAVIKVPYKDIGVIKVHLQIKLEYLFWVIQKIIENISLFTYIDGTRILPTFSGFKFRTGFFRYIFPEITSNFPFSIWDKEYKINDITYNTETQYDANIVFYTDYMTYGEYYQQQCIRHLINTLIKLFPDNLNINSDLFPRFNLRITKNIFLGIGHGDHKDKVFNNQFDNLKDFKEVSCDTFLNQLSCDKCSNEISKTITDRDLCKWNTHTKKCESSKYYSFNLLTYKDKFRTIQEIEDYIGRPLYKGINVNS
jgi:hypothetical protein